MSVNIQLAGPTAAAFIPITVVDFAQGLDGGMRQHLQTATPAIRPALGSCGAFSKTGGSLGRGQWPVAKLISVGR